MNRRDFLTRFLGGAAGAAVALTLDVDKLLWVPGEKTFFLPELETWVPNTFVSIDWFIAQGLRELKSQLTMVEAFNREWEPPHRVGDTLTIHVPKRWQQSMKEILATC